ncbi:hypothetical protein MPTA5024_07575 [Microbispora sp. ATCC PTA-5024]|nr:hypothetical protein MPTA5024_07575 [Microbispora sp. ATCC PTA-5024]
MFAGTLNGTGLLHVEVTRPATETLIARIVAMVELAGATKACTQLFIEKVEQRYSILMVTATLALFAIPLIWGEALQDSLLRAMTFMIVASPCAVVLATMPPLLAATAGRQGMLIKSAVVMEQLGIVSRVAFDKTGTLTEGRPHLTDVRLLAEAPDLTEERLLTLAAAEQGSESTGCACCATPPGGAPPLPLVEEFTLVLPNRLLSREGPVAQWTWLIVKAFVEQVSISGHRGRPSTVPHWARCARTADAKARRRQKDVEVWSALLMLLRRRVPMRAHANSAIFITMSARTMLTAAPVHSDSATTVPAKPTCRAMTTTMARARRMLWSFDRGKPR